MLSRTLSQLKDAPEGDEVHYLRGALEHFAVEEGNGSPAPATGTKTTSWDLVDLHSDDDQARVKQAVSG